MMNYEEDVFQDVAVPQERTTDYFATNPAMPNQRQYMTPTNPNSPTSPVGFVDVLHSPALAVLKVAKGAPVSGLGGVGPASVGVGALVFVAGAVILSGWLSYQAGKAMSPTKAGEKTWGWVGVPVGMFTGAFGLGIMGAVSNRK